MTLFRLTFSEKENLRIFEWAFRQYNSVHQDSKIVFAYDGAKFTLSRVTAAAGRVGITPFSFGGALFVLKSVGEWAHEYRPGTDRYHGHGIPKECIESLLAAQPTDLPNIPIIDTDGGPIPRSRLNLPDTIEEEEDTSENTPEYIPDPDITFKAITTDGRPALHTIHGNTHTTEPLTIRPALEVSADIGKIVCNRERVKANQAIPFGAIILFVVFVVGFILVCRHLLCKHNVCVGVMNDDRN